MQQLFNPEPPPRAPLTLPRIRAPRFDQIHHEISVRFETFFLRANAWPETEESRYSLLILATSSGVKLDAKSVEEDVAEFLELLRRGQRLRRGGLGR
jgi:hypothetical protein